MDCTVLFAVIVNQHAVQEHGVKDVKVVKQGFVDIATMLEHCMA